MNSEDDSPMDWDEDPFGKTSFDNQDGDLLSGANFWSIAGALLLGVILFLLYRVTVAWGHRREKEEAEARRQRLREARERQAASLEMEMEAFKETPAYAELQRASSVATGGIRPEHRGQISRHGIAPPTQPKPWRPSPAERYGRTRRGGG
ncbi:transmembrane protein [Cyclospora cayetanensis]|uniref:Transmembrane protein n=1 Tax=Cyclospora cayetanensis TaxID=88456 RepID=A0A1D3D694_9EIME|nr:transmembrane protein [Cyclospora cayetanensis]